MSLGFFLVAQPTYEVGPGEAFGLVENVEKQIRLCLYHEIYTSLLAIILQNTPQ